MGVRRVGLALLEREEHHVRVSDTDDPGPSSRRYRQRYYGRRLWLFGSSPRSSQRWSSQPAHSSATSNAGTPVSCVLSNLRVKVGEARWVEHGHRPAFWLLDVYMGAIRELL